MLQSASHSWHSVFIHVVSQSFSALQGSFFLLLEYSYEAGGKQQLFHKAHNWIVGDGERGITNFGEGGGSSL